MQIPLKQFLGAATGLLFSTLPLSGQACALGSVNVGLFDFPPYYHQTDDARPEGQLVDLFDHVMGQVGCPWQARFFDSVPRLLEAMTSGSTQIAMLIHHPLLERHALFGTRSLAPLVLNTYHLPDRSAAMHLNDLRNRRLILIRGYGYGGLVDTLLDPENGITAVIAESHRDGFKRLQANQGDYLLNYEGPATETRNAMGLYHVEHSALRTWDVVFVISRQVPQANKRLAELEAALDSASPPRGLALTATPKRGPQLKTPGVDGPP
ncbi:hypothetical protein [Motiliproteus sp. SC1-56]|uniref:hypothetical protein n=1 Tax=Motiliproteus sp. SC1-56 TaxID=2799565 RepID=UPI001A8DBC8D|nr:hypothetical protein [Motiliproteus sp. SC1-56]